MEYKPKYVIVDMVFPVIFAEAIPHEMMKRLGNITSAGFVKISPLGGRIGVLTNGHSEGLGIEAKPDDAEMIKTILKL